MAQHPLDQHWAELIASGKLVPDQQFQIPDAKYPGDVFVITDSKNRIVQICAWTGETWATNDTVFEVSGEERP